MTAALYIIEAGDAHKIGRSGNPEQRLGSLQGATAVTLRLIYTAEADDVAIIEIERGAHELLRDQRLRGEWFQVTAEVAVRAVLEAASQLGHELRSVRPRREVAPRRRGRPSGTEYRKIDVRLMPAPLRALTALARENGNTIAEEARQAIDAHIGLAPVRGIVPAARKG